MKHNKGKRQAAPTSAGKGRQLFSMVILFSMLLLAGAVVFATDGATTSYIKIEKKLELAADGIKTPETFSSKLKVRTAPPKWLRSPPAETAEI